MFDVLLKECRERIKDSWQLSDQIPSPLLHICLQEEYHLASLVRWGLCE